MTTNHGQLYNQPYHGQAASGPTSSPVDNTFVQLQRSPSLQSQHAEQLSLNDYVIATSPMRSPHHDSHSVYASPSPSISSVHSPGVVPTYSDFPLATYHGPQRSFAGFVNSPPLTSPKLNTAVFASHHAPHSQPPPSEPQHYAATPPRHRLSVSSVASSGRMRTGSFDGMDPAASPSGSMHGFGYPGLSDSAHAEDDYSNAGEERAHSERDFSHSKGRKDDKTDPPPPWSELKTKAGKERKRLPLACIACRRKKIRCSGEKPLCRHCLRSRIPCVYKVTTRKATPRTDYMAMLDKRLKKMEERVIRLIPKDSEVASIPRAIVKPAIPAPPPKPARLNKKRAAEEAFGPNENVESWARSDQISGQAGSTGVPMKRVESERTLLIDGAEFLPPKELQQHLAEVYFDYVYGQSYPLLHKPTFMRKLAAGTVPPVLVLVVCAVSARFSNHPLLRNIEPAFMRGEKWAAPAREISLRRYDSPNITILIVYLLLGLHEFGTCQGVRSWMLGGMAQRMAFVLQLHKDRDRPTNSSWGRDGHREESKMTMSSTDREVRHRVMWSCFLMDRFNSSGTDRPISLPEECIAVPLPVREKLFTMEIEAVTEMMDGRVLPRVQTIDETGHPTDAQANMGTSAYLIRLVAIWGRVVRYFNLGGHEQDKLPMWHPTSQFSQIAESLRNFTQSLPEELRWSQDNLANHKAERIDNQFVLLHIVLQHLQLYTHRFALPASGFRVRPDVPHNFLMEAARTAVDAANSVSALAQEALSRNVVAPFAGYAAFYSSTVHIIGVFARNPQMVERSKENLAINVKFLGRMKRLWGMFHFVVENLKELYRMHADTALARDSGQNHPAGGKGHRLASGIFQYGDWFDRYPNGVSTTDHQDPARKSNDDEKAESGVLGYKEKDLLSVEEFFKQLEGESPQSQPDSAKRRRSVKKAKVTVKQNQPSPNQQEPAESMRRANDIPSTNHLDLQTDPESINMSINPMDSSFDQGAPYVNTPNELSDFRMSIFNTQTATPVNPLNLNNMWNYDTSGTPNMNSIDSFSLTPTAEWYIPPWNMELGNIPPVVGVDIDGTPGILGAIYNGVNTSKEHGQL